MTSEKIQLETMEGCPGFESENRYAALSENLDVQQDLLEQLEGMDQESTDLFRRKLAQNPNLFEDMTKAMERQQNNGQS